MSSTSIALDFNEITSEESGWTTYLEDFFNNNNNESKCSISSDIELSSSLVSGAVSLAVKQVAHGKQADQFSADKTGHRSSLKKRTKATLVHDDDLEDTASSPVNIPKEKGSTSGQEDKSNKLGLDGDDIVDCEELKKRGLCLVPLSMVANYLD